MRQHSVLVIDDQPAYRRAVVRLVNASDRLTVVGDTADCHDALHLALLQHPDLILLDGSLRGATGPCIARFLRSRQHTAQVVLLSMELTRERLVEAMRAGARGYLCKLTGDTSLVSDLERVIGGENLFNEMIRTSPALAARVQAEFRTIATVAAGAEEGALQPLSPSERALLEAIALGEENPAVPSVDTIRSFELDPIGEILRKLNDNDRLELATFASRQDWSSGGLAASPPTLG